MASERQPPAATLQQILAAADEGFLGTDAAGMCTYANPAAARMLGVPQTNLVGRDIARLLRSALAGPPGAPPEEVLAGVLAGGERVRLSGCAVRWCAGPALRVDLCVTPLHEQERVTGAVLTLLSSEARDGEHQQHVEDELLQSQTWLRGVVANMPLVIWALDAQGIITFSDGLGLESLGLKPGAMHGLNMFTEFAAFPDILADARRALAGEAFTTTRQFQGITFDTRYSPLHDRNGRFVGCIVASTDITERVRAADAMLQMAEQRRRTAVLDERNRIAREIHDTLAQGFTGIIVHLEAAEAAQNHKPDESMRHMLRAQELARGSLNEARRSVFALRPTALDGVELPTALPRMARELLASSGILIDFRLDGLPRTIDTCVEENLLRIAQESLNNALRHAAAKRVEIVLCFESSALTLRVSDDGRGFDTTRRTADPGFGLVSMQERAEIIGADLTITSQVGSGTQVAVWVPDSAAPQPG